MAGHDGDLVDMEVYCLALCLFVCGLERPIKLDFDDVRRIADIAMVFFLMLGVWIEFGTLAFVLLAAGLLLLFLRFYPAK